MTNTISQPQIHPKYRSDIDGLRAVAVISVVLFHAFPEWFYGGFIGVDIFFVISGYLISTIIFENLDKNSFSFIDFYYRRTSRIFPALIAVLFSCFLFGWFLFTPIEFSQLAKHISSGSVFASNFTLWRESGYFDIGSGKKVLLHLWSLGIEEQFYLLWPILVWAAWRLKLSLWILLAISFTSSFVMNITSIGHDPVSVFYHPGTRVWELLIGAALANLHVRNNRHLIFLQKGYAKLLSGIGILLILISLILLNKDSQFPGWWALLPTLGAALIIASEPNSWINKCLLSNQILVWFGLISFPLYLWHWPLLSAAQTLNAEETTSQITRAALAILSIGLAWLTYRYVEKPLRKIENSSKKFFTLIVLMAFCGGIGYVVFKLEGLPARFQVSPLKIKFGENTCQSADGALGKPCEFGNLNSAKTVLIYGDSISGQLTNALNESLGGQYKFVYFGHTPCFLKAFDSSQHCEKLRDELYKFRGQNIFAVIRAHNLRRYGANNANEIKEYLLSATAEAETFHPKKIIISGDVQRIYTDCEFANYYVGMRKRDCGFDKSSYELNKEFFKVSNELSFPKNVFFIYPNEKICANGNCQVIQGSTSNYYDESHLSFDGALLLVPDIVQILNN